MTTQARVLSAERGRLVPRSSPAVLILALVLALVLAGSSIRAFAYNEARAFARWRLQWQLAEWQSAQSEHFILKYRAEDEDTATVVLDAAEKAYEIVTEEMNFTPPGRTLVAVYPSAEELNAAFGWSAQESALGVYWGGVICVLSPKGWIGEVDEESLREIFWAVGPTVHEFTHLVLDYKTAGNYPRWFSEGLAQYMELKHCGAVLSANSNLHLARPYSIDELEGFSTLADELLAYEQSLSLVEFMVQTGGPEIIGKIVDGLTQGLPFERALRAAGISSLTALEEGWLDWIK